MKFNYQARTKEGQAQSGIVEASSREAAAALLQKRGLYITVLEEAGRPPIYAKRIRIFKGISRKDIVLFSRQLSIMFRSKIPLIESLQILSSQMANPTFKEKIFELAEEIEGGTSFSGALSRHPKNFSSFYVAMVKAGEASGKLSESLEYLAEHLEREYNVASKIKGAMIYPALLLVFVLIVILVMVFFVFPRFVEVLVETGQELPAVTLMIIKGGDFLKKWGIALIVILITFTIFILRYYRTQEGKKFFDKIFLKIPMIGPFLKVVYISRFAENLSTLISGGLPIAQALEITGDIVGNAAYKEILLEARDEVRKGEPVSSILSREPGLFPPVLCQMALVGEKTGTLDKTLMEVVNFYQKETDRAVEDLFRILEPVLIMFFGAIVGGLMMSILMPLYKMLSF